MMYFLVVSLYTAHVSGYLTLFLSIYRLAPTHDPFKSTRQRGGTLYAYKQAMIFSFIALAFRGSRTQEHCRHGTLASLVLRLLFNCLTHPYTRVYSSYTLLTHTHKHTQKETHTNKHIVLISFNVFFLSLQFFVCFIFIVLLLLIFTRAHSESAHIVCGIYVLGACKYLLSKVLFLQPNGG